MTPGAGGGFALRFRPYIVLQVQGVGRFERRLNQRHRHERLYFSKINGTKNVP